MESRFLLRLCSRKQYSTILLAYNVLDLGLMGGGSGGESEQQQESISERWQHGKNTLESRAESGGEDAGARGKGRKREKAI